MLQNNKYQKLDNYKDKIEMLSLLLKLINLELIWYVILLGRFMINNKIRGKRKRNGNGKVLLGILLMDWIIAQVVVIIIIIIIIMMILL